MVLGFAAPWPDAVSASGTTTVTLQDDDDPLVAASFESGSYEATEGQQVTVVVLLDRDPEREVTLFLDLEHQGGATAADYSSVPSSVAFTSGVTSRTFRFAATQDVEDDDGEASC